MSREPVTYDPTLVYKPKRFGTIPVDAEFTVWNLRGVAWYDAPCPHRWHRCYPHTWVVHPGKTPTLRCACGGICAPDLPGGWHYRNDRRKSR